MSTRATGRCLCGAVTYEVHGLLRDILLRHCEECRRSDEHRRRHARPADGLPRDGELHFAELRWT